MLGNEIDAKLYTAYISGIMRGALYSLGINATVKASLDMSMTSVPTPSCSFTVIDQDRIQSVVAQATASTPSVASMAQPNAQVR